MAWLRIWFGIYNTCGCLWSNGVEKNRETDEEHDEDWAKEGFQTARVKFGRDGEGGMKALDMGNCSINIWDESEFELA